MNPPPVLLGPGGQPVELPSNWICLVCGDRPNLAKPLQVALPGAPECIVTRQIGETEPQFQCAVCWNKFWADFTRQHATRLVPVGEVKSDTETS